MSSNIRAGFSLRQYIHVRCDMVASAIHQDVRIQGDNYRMVTYNKDSTLSLWKHSTSALPRCIRKQQCKVKIEKIIYCEIANFYIMLTNQNAVLFYDSNLVQLDRYQHNDSITKIAFAPESNLLFLGNDYKVDCFLLKSDPHMRNYDIHLELQYSIPSDGSLPLTLIFIEQSRNKLIVVNETFVRAFDTSNGIERNCNSKISKRTISSVCYFEVSQLFVFGCTDGSLLVTNQAFMVLTKIQAHTGSVAALHKHLNDAVVISVGENDIRMFAIHNLIEMYSYELFCSVTDFEYINENLIIFQSTNSTGILEINTLTTPLLQLSSSIRILKTLKTTDVWKLIAISEEGLVRFISSSSGKVISSIMPKSGINSIKCITMIEDTGMAYLLMEDGDIWKLSNRGNTWDVEEVWKHAINDTCSCLETYKHKNLTFLIAATLQGSILVFDAHGLIRLKYNVHTYPILKMYISSKNSMLYCFTSDDQVKVFSLTPLHFDFLRFKGKKTLSTFPNTFHILHDTICFSGSDCLIHVTDLFEQTLEYTHERNHDHFELVTCITGHAHDRRYLSAGLDGQIKLWDMKNILICTITLGTQIKAMCFGNEDGDLILGLSDKLEIFPANQYRDVGDDYNARVTKLVGGSNMDFGKDQDEELDDGNAEEYPSTQQLVKVFGIEAMATRLEILNILSPANSYHYSDSLKSLKASDLNLTKHDVLPMPPGEEVAVTRKLKSRNCASIMDIKKNSLGEEKEQEDDVSEEILQEYATECDRLTVAEDGHIPNSVYLSVLQNFGTTSENSTPQKDQMNEAESDVNKLQMMKDELSITYREKVKILLQTMQSTEDVEENDETTEDESIIPITAEKSSDSWRSRRATPKKHAAEAPTKKLVENMVIIQTTQEILDEAFLKYTETTDCNEKLAVIKEMNTAYGATTERSITPEYIPWIISVYETVIFGTTVDSWKLKYRLIDIIKDIDSPWLLPHIMFTLTDEMSELRSKCEQILFYRGLNGPSMHPFLKQQLFSIVYEYAKRVNNKRLMNHVSTLIPEFVESSYCTCNALADIQSFLHMRLYSRLCDNAIDKSIALKIKNTQPPTLISASMATTTESKDISLKIWESPTTYSIMTALNDYTASEDKRQKRLSFERDIKAKKEAVIDALKAPQKLELLQKQLELTRRTEMREAEKQGKRVGKRKENLKEPEAVTFHPQPLPRTHIAASVGQTTRETLEFVYRTLPPLNPSQSCRKMTKLLKEQLKMMKSRQSTANRMSSGDCKTAKLLEQMKNEFPITKQNLQPFDQGSKDNPQVSRHASQPKSESIPESEKSSSANFRKYFLVNLNVD